MLNFTGACGYLIEGEKYVLVVELNNIEFIVRADKFREYAEEAGKYPWDYTILWQGKAQNLPEEYLGE